MKHTWPATQVPTVTRGGAQRGAAHLDLLRVVAAFCRDTKPGGDLVLRAAERRDVAQLAGRYRRQAAQRGHRGTGGVAGDHAVGGDARGLFLVEERAQQPTEAVVGRRIQAEFLRRVGELVAVVGQPRRVARRELNGTVGLVRAHVGLLARARRL